MLGEETESGNPREEVSLALPTVEEIREEVRKIVARGRGSEETTELITEFVIMTIQEVLFELESVKAAPGNLPRILGAIGLISGNPASDEPLARDTLE